MGFLSRKQAETAELLGGLIEPLLAADEELRGCVYATRPGRMSVKLYAIGVTDRRMIIREVDRKWRPTSDPPVSLTPDEVTVDNIFSDWCPLDARRQGPRDQVQRGRGGLPVHGARRHAARERARRFGAAVRSRHADRVPARLPNLNRNRRVSATAARGRRTSAPRRARRGRRRRPCSGSARRAARPRPTRPADTAGGTCTPTGSDWGPGSHR